MVRVIYRRRLLFKTSVDRMQRSSSSRARHILWCSASAGRGLITPSTHSAKSFGGGSVPGRVLFQSPDSGQWLRSERFATRGPARSTLWRVVLKYSVDTVTPTRYIHIVCAYLLCKPQGKVNRTNPSPPLPPPFQLYAVISKYIS